MLFGDLVSFTTLSEQRDPEEVRDLLSSYFAVARTVVGRYGGTIEKFIGDAVMAVWGVPVAHEDDAPTTRRRYSTWRAPRSSSSARGRPWRSWSGFW